MAPVVIPADAFLLVEGDRPRDHLASVLIALVLVMFGVFNIAGSSFAQPMTLRIHDTRTGKKVPFEPLVAGEGRHLQLRHRRSTTSATSATRAMMVAWDVIARHLRASGYALRFVRNITDVDDKIIGKAKRREAPAAEVARASTPTR